MKHLQTIWLIMAQFKAFTRGRLHPTLPLAGKRLWSSHSGKAQLSKKGKLVHGQWTSDERFFFFKNIPNYRQIWADGPNKVGYMMVFLVELPVHCHYKMIISIFHFIISFHYFLQSIIISTKN